MIDEHNHGLSFRKALVYTENIARQILTISIMCFKAFTINGDERLKRNHATGTRH